MGGDFLGRILRCFDESFVVTAEKLAAVAQVNVPLELRDESGPLLNSNRIGRLADIFRRDLLTPLSALGELTSILKPTNEDTLRVEAWAVLQALDRGLGPQWVSHFRRAGAVELSDGSLFPVGHVRLDSLLKRRVGGSTRLSPLPASQNPAVHFLQHLGTWNARRLKVRLEFHRHVLQFRRVAICLPNSTVGPATFDIAASRTISDEPGFYDLRPKDVEGQWSVVEGHLKRAHLDEADLVLFPELSMTELLQERVRQWRDRESFSGGILAGSAHLAATRSNRTVFGLGELDLHHHKLNPYVLRKKSSFFPLETFDRTEDLRTEQQLVVHYFGTHSVALLVCKDLMDTDLRDALARLRPSIVLVAALSDTTTVFDGAAGQLRDAGQSIVLVANTPLDQAPGALIYLPLRNEADSTHSIQRLTRPDDGYQLVRIEGP